ncbi:MAG: TatD family hydrolase [Gammaproteobacteria bacterium]|nr:TatD family hydrolase [Gammaproteobacteria bacterium]
MEIVDTHCHLDFPDFDLDRLEIIARCHQQGINRIVVPAVNRDNWQRVTDLGKAEAGCFPALGIHPMFLEHYQDGDLQALEQLLDETPVVAIGEIGLDFYVSGFDQQRQQELFEAQLSIAARRQLPVLLHVRKAHDQVLNTLKRIPVPGGIAHAFNGSLEQAQKYLELGFKLGFGGTLTYPNARRIHTLARELPLSAIVLETDAPDMVVAAHKGGRNSPEYLTDSLAALASIRGEDEAIVAAQTTRNAVEVLGLV